MNWLKSKKHTLLVILFISSINAQKPVTYNDWTQMGKEIPTHALLYLANHISGQSKSFNYSMSRLSYINKILPQTDTVAYNLSKESLEKFFAMPPNEYSVGDMTKATLVWIIDRDYLWDLPLDDLCLYARLDLFGDSDTKEWVNGLIKKAVNKNK
jgi:hypothetical protein